MLDPVTIYHITVYLATLNETFYKGNPSEVIQHLQSLSTMKSISTIAKDVKVPELDVELFFNETIPCLKNITMNAFRNNKISNTKAILESFWNNWWVSFLPWRSHLEMYQKYCDCFDKLRNIQRT